VTTVKGTTSSDAGPPRTGTGVDAGLRALIVTIYGLYAREVGGWLSVSTLIRLLARLDVDEPAVRSAISRLKRRGILEPERIDGKAGYALSAQAREILDAGDRRIFRRRRGTLDEGWVLAVFSVPESERRRRHTLRSRLSWLGFGSVGPGVWVAPAHLHDEAREMLLREDLAEYVDLFQATYLGFSAATDEVSRWWDLQGLSELYEQFCAEHTPVLARWRTRRGRDDTGMAFADYVRVLTAWRRLPYLDPGLAPELLPRDWAGTRAADLFFALQRRLEGPSHRFVDEVR
jgi:phenylacetic acid degradation operon negative regulatory protein